MERQTLKIRRIENDLTQQELADRVGLTNQTISDYESGRSNPSYKAMEKIAAELNSTVDELFFTRS